MVGRSPTTLPETKVCKTCGASRKLDEFYPNPHCKYGRAPECAECVRARKKRDYARKSSKEKTRLKVKSRDWYRSHPRTKRNSYLKGAYGLDEAGVAKLYEGQNGACPVCGKPIGWDEKNIDHDHDTGRIRGLVHPYCNTGVGFLDNHRDRIPEILAYLGVEL